MNMKKDWPFYLVMVLGLGAYFMAQFLLDIPEVADTVTAATALVAVVAVWLEMRHNQNLNEATFIMELNSQFVNNPDMARVEHKLEVYNYHWKRCEKKAREALMLDLDVEIDGKDRQALINYLVYLEGLATMARRGVLDLDSIDDLFAYRFFIAFNNPVVQKMELQEYQEYYQGCFWLNEQWTKRWKKANRAIPLTDQEEGRASDGREEEDI